MKIGISYDADLDVYSLTAIDDRMGATPAGPRLFRAPPYPEIKFAHDNKGDALRDAATLQKYIDVAHSITPKRR